jgi:hypothetical protein
LRKSKIKRRRFYQTKLEMLKEKLKKHSESRKPEESKWKK